MDERPHHLYLHVPFCAHRCGYCDFVTVTGNESLHAGYVAALIDELGRRDRTERFDTVFIGGGTPSLLMDDLLARLLAAVPTSGELTVECNPETLTERRVGTLIEGGVTRVSLGAQSFRPHLLEVLERLARPEAILRSVDLLRAAGLRSLSLDLMFGVPGQSAADLEADLDQALDLSPDHISYYELEAKPGTRFSHAHGAELQRQAERLEGHYERVVERLRKAGYRWYETANFCRPGHEARHNLGYWQGRNYLGIGVGAVSTLGLNRSRNRPGLRGYLDAVAHGRPAPADVERLTPKERATERLMLGLRLDRPLELDGLEAVVDVPEASRLANAGLLVLGTDTMQLTDRGRFMANEVVSRILR